MQYGGCPNGALVELYIINDGGTHGRARSTCRAWLHDHQINATDLIWSFFSAYSLDADGDTLGEASDNCPTVTNIDQADADGDALGAPAKRRCTAPIQRTRHGR